MSTPRQILEDAWQQASQPFPVSDPQVSQQVRLIVRNAQNRAAVRLVLACLLAKLHLPSVDIRKPYTEIGDPDVFSGRTYDEKELAPFLLGHQLPINETTAFLTPALRNRNQTLTKDTNLVGRPQAVYQAALALLDAVHSEKLQAQALLVQILAELVSLRDENKKRLDLLFYTSDGILPLSSQEMWVLLEQHSRSPRSSRLPVLMVAAVYHAIGGFFDEHIMPLHVHQAADKQTGALGDIEVFLTNDQQIKTGFEIKAKKLDQKDIDIALTKILRSQHLQNYIFITTEAIDPDLMEYTRSLYERTNGVEVTILDCMGFIHYFLHFFHRQRFTFLETYQTLLLEQPESAVGQALKETWLSLRRAAESR
jgi:hypothetical protein